MRTTAAGAGATATDIAAIATTATTGVGTTATAVIATTTADVAAVIGIGTMTGVTATRPS
jgi:hypothetical protein